MSTESNTPRPATLRQWLSRKLDVIAILIAASGLLNAAGALFILHVYDNAIPDHSLASLGLAFAAVVTVYVLQSGLRFMARRRAGRVATQFLDQFEPAALRASRAASAPADAETRLADIRHFARFLRSKRLIVVLDLTWAPFFLACLFYISPLIGLFSIVILAVLGFATWILQPDWVLQPDQRQTVANKMQRGAGETEPDHRGHLLAAVASALKNIAHAGVLAVGAWLVITDRLEVGELMASSMLMMRLFSPARALADEWQDLRRIRPLWHRLRDLEWTGIRSCQKDRID